LFYLFLLSNSKIAAVRNGLPTGGTELKKMVAEQLNLFAEGNTGEVK